MLTGSNTHQPTGLPYAEENEKIRNLVNRGHVDSSAVVFLGASISRRWNLEEAFPKAHMINRGVGGQLVPDMLTRFHRDVIELQPRAVVIKFCSINIRPHMPLKILEDGMTMMTQLARANDIRPIVSTIIPAAKAEAHIGDFSVVDSLRKFNYWVRQYADEEGLLLIDFAGAIETEDGFLPRDCATDPVHVNDKGYRILAEAGRPVIYKAIGVDQ